MIENQLIDETLLFLTYTDQTQGGLEQRGNPLLRVWYNLDENWHSALCQVFSRVYRYDFWYRANCVGVAEANREIIKIAEMYRPKYVLWPANTFTVIDDTLMALRKIGCVVVGRFFDDDHYFNDRSKWLIPSLDYCVTNVPRMVSQYESMGARCIPMPIEGHDDAIWQPLPHIPKRFDVSFVGTIYPERHNLLSELRELGVSVQVFDNDWGRNMLTLNDLVRVTNESKINLNLTAAAQSLGMRQMKGRMFEVTQCGGFLLTEYAPDLERYFEVGLEVISFDTAAEAAKKIRYYLEHPDEREAIAARGYERARRDYTARVLFRNLFLQIENDLQRRGRPVLRERLVGVNPLRKAVAEYHYQWAKLLLNTRAPLRHTWRESIQLALANDSSHKKANLMLKTNGMWRYVENVEGPLIRLAKVMRFIGLRETAMRTHLCLLRKIRGKAPIGLDYWVSLRSRAGLIFRRPNPLFLSSSLLQTFGKSLAIPDLQQLLWNDVLGEWSLDATTISILWCDLHNACPAVILECGCGISTLCLAKYAQLQSAKMGTRCTVISLEQDEHIKRMVEQRLAENGLDKWAEILYAPIIVEHEHDIEIWNYDADRANLSAKLGARKADWVLVDGPAGPKGCRFGTVPMLAKFSRRGASWFLDDAFRDGELEILRRWQRLPNIKVVGIYPIAKGLATGYFAS
ncbi:MAG: glycosyltransferase [Dehalococcoidia bacterium]